MVGWVGSSCFFPGRLFFFIPLFLSVHFIFLLYFSTLGIHSYSTLHTVWAGNGFPVGGLSGWAGVQRGLAERTCRMVLLAFDRPGIFPAEGSPSERGLLFVHYFFLITFWCRSSVCVSLSMEQYPRLVGWLSGFALRFFLKFSPSSWSSSFFCCLRGVWGTRKRKPG
ncbi:hypothetical protein B0J18DRAFT_414678 [Chaetomium sp. MPI-SDFR-AT-0129]|nr:hypothetical protein B0J18DRAFT_414678 [Chaetomium sp. MPI-SDFR-AT-0129]